MDTSSPRVLLDENTTGVLFRVSTFILKRLVVSGTENELCLGRSEGGFRHYPGSIAHCDRTHGATSIRYFFSRRLIEASAVLGGFQEVLEPPTKSFTAK